MSDHGLWEILLGEPGPLVHKDAPTQAEAVLSIFALVTRANRMFATLAVNISATGRARSPTLELLEAKVLPQDGLQLGLHLGTRGPWNQVDFCCKWQRDVIHRQKDNFL